jgi:putative peptidoglycan lipid II flippase
MGALQYHLAQRIDWIGLGQQGWLRASLMAACLLASALVYFGTLWLLRLDLRQFARRA